MSTVWAKKYARDTDEAYHIGITTEGLPIALLWVRHLTKET